MSPITFAQRLLSLWGATLEQVVIEEDDVYDEAASDGNISKIYYCSSEWKQRNEIKIKELEQQRQEIIKEEAAIQAQQGQAPTPILDGMVPHAATLHTEIIRGSDSEGIDDTAPFANGMSNIAGCAIIETPYGAVNVPAISPTNDGTIQQ